MRPCPTSVLSLWVSLSFRFSLSLSVSLSLWICFSSSSASFCYSDPAPQPLPSHSLPFLPGPPSHVVPPPRTHTQKEKEKHTSSPICVAHCSMVKSPAASPFKITKTFPTVPEAYLFHAKQSTKAGEMVAQWLKGVCCSCLSMRTRVQVPRTHMRSQARR